MFNNGAPEPPSLWDQAKALIDQGEYDKAAEIYDYILLTYSDNDAAVEYASACLGDLYLTTLRLDLSKRHLKKAILLNPVDPGYHYLLGFAYMVKEQWRKAVREFRKAHEADPDNGEYERCLGWAIFNSGDRQKGRGRSARWCWRVIALSLGVLGGGKERHRGQTWMAPQ